MAINKAAWCKFFPADYLIGTAGMSREEKGAYMDLLCFQWVHDGLPGDWKFAEALLNPPGEVSARIRRKFKIGRGGKLRNARMEKEWKAQTDKRKEYSKAGKASAEKRANERSTNVATNVEQTYQRNANIPEARSQKPDSPPTSPLDAVRAALRFAGVVGGLEKCAEKPGLTAPDVLALLDRAKREKVKNPAGWLVHHLKNGFSPQKTFPAMLICDWINAGLVAEIAGKTIDGRAKFNSEVLIVNAETESKTAVPINQLTASTIVLRLPNREGSDL